jgi:hypothetical protein
MERVTIIVTVGRQLRQVGLFEGFQEAKRWDLDKIWTKFFYKANIPFIVSKNKAFREAVRKTGEFY